MVRNVGTTKITGGAEYAKVADRLKLFREDYPNSKTETKHDEVRDFEGNYLYTIFKAWIWKDKATLIELAKSGVTDVDTLRATADSDGDAKGKVGTKEKDFEKLQTIAIGRALATLGYMASGEVASFEEMEEYYRDKAERQQQYVQEQVDALSNASSLEELKELWAQTNKAIPEILEAKDKRKTELETKKPAPKPKTAPKPKQEVKDAPSN